VRRWVSSVVAALAERRWRREERAEWHGGGAACKTGGRMKCSA
jgi:hypothetical protein